MSHRKIQDLVGANDPIVKSMLRHWKAGLRDGDFHWAVRDEFPNITLAQFNDAAIVAWNRIRAGSSAGCADER